MTTQILGFVLALVIVVGGCFYLFQSGSLALIKQTFSLHLSTSTFSYALSPPSAGPASPPVSSSNSHSPPPPKTSGGQVSPPASTSTPARPPIDPSLIPKGFTAKDLSPQFKRIRIYSARAGSFGDNSGKISLYASLDKGEKVDITGWQFKANHGGEFIPGAVALYNPVGSNPESDIFVESGDYVYFYAAPNPNQKNMRINECMGYLNVNSIAAGYGSIFSNNCPYPDRSELRGFTGQCQDYILSISRCQLPDPNPPLSNYDYACRAYLNTNLNYNGCFQKYLKDPDFLSNEWWIWTGGEILDARHDDLLLLDNKGLLVDEYSY